MAQERAVYDRRCAACNYTYYCSDACAEEDDGHALVCDAYRRISTLRMDRDGKSVLRLALAAASRRKGERMSVSVSAQARAYVGHGDAIIDTVLLDGLRDLAVGSEDPVDECLADVVSPRTYTSNFQELAQLQSHLVDWTPRDHDDWRKTIQLADKYLADAQLSLGQLSSASFISLVESNAFGVYTERGLMAGRAIYPRASLLNHSCESNAEAVRDGRTMRIIAKRDIANGEEITISYVDTNAPLSARVDQLQRAYFFRCQCQRCEREEREAQDGARTRVTYAGSARTPKPKLTKRERFERREARATAQHSHLQHSTT